jgi:hypothetical protein
MARLKVTVSLLTGPPTAPVGVMVVTLGPSMLKAAE